MGSLGLRLIADFDLSLFRRSLDRSLAYPRLILRVMTIVAILDDETRGTDRRKYRNVRFRRVITPQYSQFPAFLNLQARMSRRL